MEHAAKRARDNWRACMEQAEVMRHDLRIKWWLGAAELKAMRRRLEVTEASARLWLREAHRLAA